MRLDKGGLGRVSLHGVGRRIPKSGNLTECLVAEGSFSKVLGSKTRPPNLIAKKVSNRRFQLESFEAVEANF